MKRIFKFIYQCHKWFGIPLGIMFIMWYVSGAVMLYHRFPNLSPSGRPSERVDSAELRRMWSIVPDSFPNCIMTFSGERLQIKAGDTLVGGYTPDRKDLERIAQSFSTRVERVDTLSDVDKWIPFDRMRRDLPIYRVVGADDSYTYVSSRTGELLQRCTLSERGWAWIGALPHYVYITPLRCNIEAWRWVIIVLSGLSTVSVIFGLVIAVRFLIRRRRLAIFRKRMWQWHYASGLFFGITMLAFIFSGMMSLAKIPDWIIRPVPLKVSGNEYMDKKDVNLDAVPAEFGQIAITCESQPIMKVTKGSSMEILPADPAVPLDFSDNRMKAYVERITGEKVTDISSVAKGVFYRSKIPGTECRTENFTAYWNDKGYFRIFDSKGKVQAICYRFLHNMQIPVLEDNPVIHDIFMWILLLGGLSITVTGLVLSVKAIGSRHA